MGVALLLYFLGRHIADGRPRLISGYSPQRYPDGLGLAAWVGPRIMAMGLITGLTGLALVADPERLRTWFYSHLFGMAVIGVHTLLGMRRFRQ